MPRAHGTCLPARYGPAGVLGFSDSNTFRRPAYGYTDVQLAGGIADGVLQWPSPLTQDIFRPGTTTGSGS